MRGEWPSRSPFLLLSFKQAGSLFLVECRIYGPLEKDNAYQVMLRRNRDGSEIKAGNVADSHRFARHKPEIEVRFARIIKEFRPGIQLSEAEREKLEINKHRIAPLSPDEACHTLTSLPDDLVHYSEPRIPTVREYARIQSFPDWFQFKVKYTTGDKLRIVQVPRYTQVANAVPPLLAEAIGQALSAFREKIQPFLRDAVSISDKFESDKITTVKSKSQNVLEDTLLEEDLVQQELIRSASLKL